jgi:hypothetical protein
MGYACPVCEAPQADAEHLANHLAFTAILRGGDHETFLDEHVPDWADRDPAGLADEVVEHADEREFDHAFEDAPGGHDHRHAQPSPVRERPSDEEVERVLEEARELTERRSSDGDKS